MRTAEELSKWQGYLTLNEVKIIKDIASLVSKKKPIFVNIGAGAGTSTISLLEANQEAVLFSVDILATGSEITTNEHLRLEECGDVYLRRVKRIWGDSKLVGVNWPIKVDLVFIDGDHSYIGCAGDIKAWVPHVHAGGYVLFHDFGSPVWPDVRIAVEELMPEYGGKLLHRIDTVAVYKLGS